MTQRSDAIPPLPRSYGAINWLGFRTLLGKEIRRFLKVHFQTVTAPVVTTLLFLAVFALALGRVAADVHGVPFTEFLAPGLIMMAMVQNSFANTSSSLIIAKVQGNIVDLLMPPLTAFEQTAAIALGGAVRGLVVGVVVTIAIGFFVTIHIHALGFIVFHAIAGSLMLSLLGMAAGIWADKFDHMAAVTNFLITPLSFLSGTFYSIDRLPDGFRLAAHLNPFFYMIDGFRYGFIGHADSSVWLGVGMVTVVDIGLFTLTWRMLATGYKLKA